MIAKLAAIILLISFLTLSGCSSDSDDQLYAVRIGEDWGYINICGDYVINPQFDYADAFHCGLARVLVNRLTYFGQSTR